MSMKKKLVELELRIKKLEEASKELMTVEETAEFLDVKTNTIYMRVKRGNIPHYKDGKKLYFMKSEIINNLKKVEL